MRSDKQNRSVRAVATSIVFDHVFSNHLPDAGPKISLANCNLKDTLSLTDEEKRCTRERYKVLIGRILVEFFPAFYFLKDFVLDHTPCEYHKEMSTNQLWYHCQFSSKMKRRMLRLLMCLISLSSGHVRSTARRAFAILQTQSISHLVLPLELLLDQIK